eukprot:2013829-Alexandrium_andersonii.AAC.1
MPGNCRHKTAGVADGRGHCRAWQGCCNAHEEDLQLGRTAPGCRLPPSPAAPGWFAGFVPHS